MLEAPLLVRIPRVAKALAEGAWVGQVVGWQCRCRVLCSHGAAEATGLRQRLHRAAKAGREGSWTSSFEAGAWQSKKR